MAPHSETSPHHSRGPSARHDENASLQACQFPRNGCLLGDAVLARDHLSSQKWQPGKVRRHSLPHSHGQVWRRHVLQNSPSPKPIESRTPPVEAATKGNSAEFVPHSQCTANAHHDRMFWFQKRHHLLLLLLRCVAHCALQNRFRDQLTRFELEH